MNLYWDRRIRWLPMVWLSAFGCDSTAVVTVGAPCDAGAYEERSPCTGGPTSSPMEDSESPTDNADDECTGSGCSDPQRCGNGEAEGDEECDDGNLVPGDGCDEFCFDELEPCATSPENVVSNALFDRDIDDWSGMNELGVSGAFDRRSARGTQRSGSLAVTLELEQAAEGRVTRVSAAAFQCIDLPERTDYELSAYYLVDDRGPDSAAANLALFYFGEEDCGGETVAQWNSPESIGQGSWGIITETLATPRNTRSLLLRLAVSKKFSDAAATVLFDGVALVPRAEAANCSLYDAANNEEPEPGEDPPVEPEPEPQPVEPEPVEPEPEPEPVEPEPEPAEPEPAEPQPEPEPVEPEPEPEPVEPEAPPALSYADDVEPIFTATCVDSCHAPNGLGGPGGLFPTSQLDLSPGAGYEALVGTPSLQLTSMSLVGESADESYLWLKVTGGAGEGDQMPSGGADPLSSEALDIVRRWIESGANP
jgi:cysteine-rich repeat protein